MDASVLKKTLAAASANNIALSQTPTSGTPLTLNGAAVVNGVAVLDTQRRVLLTFGDEAGNRTLVLSGTNGAGVSIGETLAVPSGGGGTVASQYDYLTITQALPEGGGWTAAATLGTNTVGSTPWWIPTHYVTPFEVAADIEFPNGTGPTASVEYTDDTLLQPMSIYGTATATIPPPIANAWPGLSAVAVNSYSVINRNVSGIRLTVTGTGTLVQTTLRQSGILQG